LESVTVDFIVCVAIIFVFYFYISSQKIVP
jgi:hypothetical protein